MRRSLGFFLMASIGFAATIRPDDPAAAEAKRLEGIWKVVALESDGQKAPAATLEALAGRWTFKDSEVSFMDVNDRGRSSFKVDPGKSPKEIDFIGLDEPRKGQRMEGIYRLVDGELTICLRDVTASGKGRPKEFAAEAGSELGLIVLKRSDPQ
jgi:uncharacterized protein (TIGR03067 family)